jgi:hypothetical protein
MKLNNQEKGWKARGIPKGGFGRVLARKATKGEKFWSAGSTSLTSLFFCFLFLHPRPNFWRSYNIATLSHGSLLPLSCAATSIVERGVAKNSATLTKNYSLNSGEQDLGRCRNDAKSTECDNIGEAWDALICWECSSLLLTE